MRYLYLDLETFSEVPINCGTHVYAANAEIMLCAWAIDHYPVRVIDLTAGERYTLLKRYLRSPNITVVIHNSHFDRTVIRHAWAIAIPTSRIHDTMIQAMAHGLPAALGTLCEILGLPADKAKDKEGKKLIQLFCKPLGKNRKLDRATRLTHPVEWEKFKDYAASDVEAMREIMKRMPTVNLTSTEKALWELDQRVNDHGVAIDMALVHAAIDAVDLAQVDLAAQTMELTEGSVASTTKTAALRLQIFEMFGIDMPNMQMSTVEKTIDDPSTPPAMAELLAVRLQASSTSTSKYKVLRRGTSADGRLRGTLQFDGASRTGRWAGRLFQPQNLPRPTLKQPLIDAGIEAMKAGCAHLVTDNVMALVSSSIRSCIVAPYGKKLEVADLSNIEGRVQAWLANEEWKLQAFRDYDTITGVDAKGKPVRRGHDLYKLAYAKAFGIKPEDVTDDQRQVGKVMELACFGPDTPVLTNTGVKSIGSITKGDLLWDGIQWVQHQGLIARGRRSTINLAGIEVTPDHLIKTGATWTPAQQLVLSESTLCQALATGSENLPYWVSTGVSSDRSNKIWSRLSALAERSRIWCTGTTCVKGPARAAIAALKNKLGIGVKVFLSTPMFAPMTITEGGCSTGWLRAKLDVTARAVSSTKLTAAEEFTFGRYGERTRPNFCDTLLRSPVGIFQSLTWIASMSIKVMNRGICASYPWAKTGAEINVRSKKCSGESENLRPVFDILNSGPNNRFTVMTTQGALIVHNCGYEGGVGAFATFARTYGIDLSAFAVNILLNAPEDVIAKADNFLEWTKKDRRPMYDLTADEFVACDTVKRMWRDAHPNIHNYWGRFKDAVIMALNTRGTTYTTLGLKIKASKNWLIITMPSGRSLCYPSPKLVDGAITYMGIDQFTRKWVRQHTHGGKLFENLCQAVARDIMAANMPLIEEAGYEIILTVHDEIISEAQDLPQFNPDHLASLLAANPSWAPDIPLAAAGFETYRYRKG